MRSEDRREKLEMLESELKSVGDRLSFIYGQFSGELLHFCFESLKFYLFVIDLFNFNFLIPIFTRDRHGPK